MKKIVNNEEEIWKSHPDIVGIEVSTLGRVRTLYRLESSEERTQFTKGHVLKPCANGSGYLRVNIKVDGKWATKRVNRLVAQTFLPNQDDLPMVNHKNCNRSDNRVSNLEFCTASYNRKYQEEFGKSKGLPLLAINLSTLELARFRSQGEASRELGVNRPDINKVVKGRAKQTGGFLFVNDDENAVDTINRKLHDIEKTGLKIK